MRDRFVCTVAVLALSIWQWSSVAAGADKKWKANAERGRQLAERLCSSCHLVGTNQNSSAAAGVPSFRAVAAMPGRTSEHITNILIRPHAPMPDSKLTMHEIGDLLAYIDTLRPAGGTKPDAGGEPAVKPTYPSPS